MLGISRWSVVQNVKKKRGLYFLVNYFWLRWWERFPELPGSLESRNPLQNLNEAIDPITGGTEGGKKRKAIHEYCTCLISVRNLSVFQKSLFSNCPCHLTSWEKGDQKATWICKKVSFVGTTEIELTAPSQTKLPSPVSRDFTMKKKKTETKQKNQLTRFKVFGSDILLSENYSKSINQSFLSLSVCPLISQGTPEFSNSWTLLG